MDGLDFPYASGPSTSSARLDSRAFRAHCVHVRLIRLARERGHDALILGDSSTRLAIKTLSGMAQGRGYGLGEEIGGLSTMQGSFRHDPQKTTISLAWVPSRELIIIRIKASRWFGRLSISWPKSSRSTFISSDSISSAGHRRLFSKARLATLKAWPRVRNNLSHRVSC
jgi:hypothetical protein